MQSDSSPKLVKLATKGNLPPFNKNMVGTVLDEYSGTSGKIVIYLRDQTTGAARFNLFDTVTGIWTGSGLVDPWWELAIAPSLLPPRKNTSFGHAANSANEISAGGNETAAGRSEPNATDAISNDTNSNQPPVFWVVTIGSIVVVLCLLSAVLFFIVLRQRRRLGTSTFIMSSPLPPTSKHDLLSSVDPILARDRIKVLYPEPQSPAQPHNHQIIRSIGGGASHYTCHYCADGYKRPAPSPLNYTTTSATMATTEARANTATAAATTSNVDSRKYAQPTIPVISQPQPSQLDLSSISLSSNHNNLGTSNTPLSSTLTTPDHPYFDSFCHLQHGWSRVKKRQTGSPLTTEEVTSSPIPPPDQIPAFPGHVATTTTTSSRPQRPALTYNPSTTSLARGPHTVLTDESAVQVAFKEIFAFQATTTASTIIPSNAHTYDPTSARPPQFS